MLNKRSDVRELEGGSGRRGRGHGTGCSLVDIEEEKTKEAQGQLRPGREKREEGRKKEEDN